jgi:DNA-binding NtrC family response regulator
VTDRELARVLMVDTPADVAAVLCLAGEDRRHVALAETEQTLDQWAPHVVLTCLEEGCTDGQDRVRRWLSASSGIEVVVVRWPEASLGTADLLRAGASAVLTRPFEPDALVVEVQRATERSLLRAENRRLRRQLDGPARFPSIIGQSKKMREVLDLVDAVAASDANILVLGENGSGKEMIADVVHAHSTRASGPFIKINCAAIPRDLIESELFGYRRGAFTGAHSDKAGLLAMAQGGSVLLDEVGEMPAYLQAKLLRVLQEREYRPLGSDQVVRVDFRLLCATNVDVDVALRERRLREDLFFRINTITVRVPPLRDRLEDLAPLCQYFLRKYNEKHGRQIRAVGPGAYQRMMRHRWPGNVRELENVVERGVLVARGDELTAEDLPTSIVTLPPTGEAFAGGVPADLTLAEIERLAILQALQRTHGNKQKAAQLLGLYRPTLYSKMQKHGIDTPPRSARRNARPVEAEPVSQSLPEDVA